MKRLQLSDILLNESNKVLQTKTEMLFSDIFLLRCWPNGTLTDITMSEKAPGQYPTNRKRQSKSWSGCRKLNQ